MRFFSIFLFLILSFSARSSVTFQGAVPSVTLGGTTLPLGQAMVMSTICSNNTYYDTFRYKGASYQVPSSKKLICVASSIASDTAGSHRVTFGSADAAAVVQAAAPTGMALTNLGTRWGAASTGTVQEHPIYIEFASLKYPTIQCGNSGNEVYLCYLQ